MEKYVIVSMIETNFPEEFQSVNWPLHVTLLRPFVTSATVDNLSEILQTVSSTQPIIVTEGKSKELFGVERTVAVTELINTPALQHFHEAIKSAFINLIEFTSTEYPSFRPHVTEHHGKGVQVGELVQMSSVSLVTLNTQSYRVVNTFLLPALAARSSG